MKFFLWVGLPFVVFIGFRAAVTDLVPAWQAHGGSGTVGIFTAEREECGKRSCDFYGSWVAADGSKRLDDIGLYDEPDSLIAGRTVEAVDTGAPENVFATAGGSTYLLLTAFPLAGVAALVGWVFVIRNAFRRRRAAAVPA